MSKTPQREEPDLLRRSMLVGGAAAALMPRAAIAQGAGTIRIGVPTKTYWPTIICETAIRQKLFEKEGIKAELTIYRSGAEGFEAIAAGAADLVLNSSSSVAGGLKKGVNVELCRQRRQRLLRLVPGREDGLADQEGVRARGQEGRHHVGRLRHRHPGALDASPSTRSISRACRSVAAAWCRTC